MLLTWALSVVGCHITDGVVAPASYVKKGGGGESCCSPEHYPSFIHHQQHAPYLVCEKKRGGGESYCCSLEITRTVMMTCIITIWMMCQAITIHHCHSSIVGCHVATPCFWCEKRRGEGSHIAHLDERGK